MMKYYKTYKDNGERVRINRAEAYRLMDGSYQNIDQLLEIPNRYPLMFCVIEVADGQEYTGAHRVGEIVNHRGHECKVTRVWVDPDVDKNGISIIPTGDYGFEIDIYEEQLHPVFL